MSLYPPPIETPVKVMPSLDSASYVEMRDHSGYLLLTGLARDRLLLERVAVTMNNPARAQADLDAAALLEYTETHQLTSSQRLAVLAARDWMQTDYYERQLAAAALREEPAP